MDRAILLAIQDSANPFLDRLFWWLSDQLTFAFPLLILLACLAVFRYRLNGLKAWGLIIPLIILADMSGREIKSLFQHPRPCQEIYQQLHFPDGQQPHACGKELNGMPSNHAINYFAVSMAIFLITRHPIGLFLFGISIAVGVSRIYLGKHYPSQVFLGSVIGLLIGWGYAWLCLRYFEFLRTMGANQHHKQ
ncbi:MAG: phosphatase PAP2 family protein [Gammaproteobacteria bacterium]|nr:MAG: phosphatase PAP2 family protein [Gammaproteobacteria bacterium]